MTRIAVTLCLLTLASAACRKAHEADPSRDEYGCRYPERYFSEDPWPADPDEVHEYRSCSDFGRFRQECASRGYEMVGSACRRVRNGKAEYTGRSPYLGLYDLNDEGAWDDCKPKVLRPVEPGDPLECYGLEPDIDPASAPWSCVVEPPAWCPSAP